MGSWSLVGDVNNGRDVPAVITLQDGNVLSFGGWNGTNLNTSELYNPTTQVWTAKGLLPHGVAYPTAVVLASGMVLQIGGAGPNNQIPIANCALYDPSTGLWTATGSLNSARWANATFLLPNGNVLVAGGIGADSITSGILLSAEIYDVGAGTWSFTGSMATERSFVSYAVAASGKCVVFGGDQSGSTVTNTIEVYDPTAATWSTKSSVLPNGFGLEASGCPCAIKLASGPILYVSGRTSFQGQGLASVNTCTYEESTDTLVVKGNLTTGRVNAGLFLLQNGKVLIAAGAPGPDALPCLQSSEIYDPAAGTWTVDGDLPVETSVGNTMVGPVLHDGTTMIAGGANTISGDILQTQLYTPTGGGGGSAKKKSSMMLLF